MADTAARTSLPRPLARLARLHGIQTRYKDTTGRWRTADPAVVEAVLDSMGVRPGPDGDVESLIRSREEALASRPAPASAALWLDDPEAPLRMDLRLPDGADPGSLDAVLTTEEGEVHEWRARPRILGDGGNGRGADAVLEIPVRLPPGYHRMELGRGERTFRTTLVAAPRRSWRGTEGDDGGAGDARAWGTFMPLYALRSEESWGTGSFSDLRRLLEWTRERGGDFVGTLPLLAGAEEAADDPRVYAPDSRLFWNEVYVDVEEAPGLDGCAEAREILASPGFRRELERLRDTELVDWKGSVDAKRKVLEPLAAHALGEGLPDPVRAFLDRKPEAGAYARFRATREVRGTPWREWGADDRLPRPDRTDDGRFLDAYRYHLWVQWLAEKQIAALGTDGLYLDLPLGCHPEGFDAWRHRSLFADRISVGAPPDDFFAGGQDWGFPPALPDAMEATGFDYTRASVRHHMAHASRLRLDHVMGLHRLYWIPPGASPEEGVYVRYPHEPLHALLCLESHRSRTRMVGENLGTVSRKVDRSLARHGMDGMFVAQFELGPDPVEDPPRPPRRSLASVGTHDTPTFAGFWRGLDVEMREETGMRTPEEAERERRDRARLRERWVELLVQEGRLPRGTRPDQELSVLTGTLTWLAGSRAASVLVALEDLWLEEKPQNVPGRADDLPVFRRKARYDLEEITRLEKVGEILRRVDAAREDDTSPTKPSTTPSAMSRAAPADTAVRTDVSRLTDDDLHLFNEGNHFRLYRKLGAHLVERDGVAGVHFGVWAPNAEGVAVQGDFNGWDADAHPLAVRGASGIWEGFVPGVERGDRYKYHIRSRERDYRVDKADPFGVRHEEPPQTASVVWDLEYEWGDQAWMERRGETLTHDAPVSIYELHPGSWKRDEDGEPLTYRELAPALIEHVHATGFTHVEFLPVMEHPFYGSWGYQTTGYFAPTSRYGTPQDFMYLVDRLHQAGIGVVLDWVPSHFPGDEHGLAYFDGTHLFEHQDPREGFHPDWKSYIFNYGRHEVRSFLISSALFWLDHFHADGLRVDAVASMLYRDYGRSEGEWIPNEHGGRENLEAIGFLRRLNEAVYESYPDVETMAEESTAWPMVSRPTYLGGLGFGMKWDMGWMHDTLQYMGKEPVHRKFHHDDLTFRRVYAFSENFVLPLSHDEVVHGKGSLLGRMPGDTWQQFANLRLLLAYQTTQPGKKLLFMGGEFGQGREWNHDDSLDWHLLDIDYHEGIQRLVGDLNRVYRAEPALHERDFLETGFEWLDAGDWEQSILSFLRLGHDPDDLVAVVFNFTPVPRENYRLGVSRPGVWEEILNTDAEAYGGSGRGNLGRVEATPVPYHGRNQSLILSLPPLAALVLRAPPRPGSTPSGSTGKVAPAS